jgi:hypothetical protein
LTCDFWAENGERKTAVRAKAIDSVVFVLRAHCATVKLSEEPKVFAAETPILSFIVFV